MFRMVCPALLTVFLAGPALAQGPASPSFRDIEYRYSGEEALEVGRKAVLEAIPIGTPLDRAEALLTGAGARCKPIRRSPGIIRCLYDEVSTVDEALDDIRWETVLHVDGGLVSSISIDREVDRHGSA